MFTQECLLRNVGEAKMHVMLELTKRGYSPMYINFENNVGGNNMVCEGQTWHCTDSDNKPYCVDCGENIDLFLAIASLRDDADKYQYFICDKVSITLGKTYYPDDYLYYQYDEFFDKQNWHKATVEELIKFFNK